MAYPFKKKSLLARQATVRLVYDYKQYKGKRLISVLNKPTFVLLPP